MTADQEVQPAPCQATGKLQDTATVAQRRVWSTFGNKRGRRE